MGHRDGTTWGGFGGGFLSVSEERNTGRSSTESRTNTGTSQRDNGTSETGQMSHPNGTDGTGQMSRPHGERHMAMKHISEILFETFSTMPWQADEAACYGICCHQHGTCARYAAVDGNTNDHQVFIDNCGADHPAYVPQSRAHAHLPGGEA